jgi:tetrapyrrole methylase family protein/MazG family protein
MIDFISKERYGFDDLVRLVSLLRAPGGCPWDGAQTHESIRRNFLEETYEVCEAFDRDDPALMCEELGDVLLQVLFHTDIEREAGRFTLDDVCSGECKKLVYRHPFLFGGDTGKDWEQLKQQEKGQTTPADALDAVARSLPALWRGEKLIRKAEKAGLLPESGALPGTASEKAESVQNTDPGDRAAEEKLGELLLAAVQEAVRLNIDPEQALHGACERLIGRCRTPEQKKQQ